MENNTRIRQLVNKLLTGNISPRETRELNDWYDTQGTDMDGEIVDEVSENKEAVKTRMFQRLQNEIKVEKHDRNRVLESIWSLRKIAAIFIIMVGGVYLLANNWPKIDTRTNPVAYKVFSTQNGERSKFMLPDGSEVWLNTNSELKYTDQFNQGTRKVYLTGEAFFDVIRDEEHPFTIHAKDVTTTVLGTSFNIKAKDDEDIEVTVATGKVKVASTSSYQNKMVLLTPNQQATYIAETHEFSRKDVDLNIYLTWKEEKLTFDEISLSKAMAMLERRYGAKISIKNERLKNCIIIGEHGNESLENVLKAMQFVLGFEYAFKSPGEVEIYGEGCTK